MITPFNLKAKVDFDAVSRLLDLYLADGIKGFFANCLSSEMYSISEDERLELTQHIVNYVRGRVPIVATGSFGLTIEDKAEFAKKNICYGQLRTLKPACLNAESLIPIHSTQSRI